MNIDGKAVQGKFINNYCCNLEKEYSMNTLVQQHQNDSNGFNYYPHGKLNRQQYKNLNNCPIPIPIPNTESNQRTKNSLLTITEYIKDKAKEGEIDTFHCSSLNSDLQLLNHKNERNMTIYKPIPKNNPIMCLGKRQREAISDEDYKELLINNNKTTKHNVDPLSRLKSIANDNYSAQSYKSYLSNYQYTNGQYKLNASESMKRINTYEDIQNELLKTNDERDKIVNGIKKTMIPIVSLKTTYEEKKQILLDYYKNKNESLNEIKAMFEKEKAKKLNSFQYYKSTENDSMSFKGKEKEKSKGEISKQYTFSINQSQIKNSLPLLNNDKNNNANFKKDENEDFNLKKNNISFTSDSLFGNIIQKQTGCKNTKQENEKKDKSFNLTFGNDTIVNKEKESNSFFKPNEDKENNGLKERKEIEIKTNKLKFEIKTNESQSNNQNKDINLFINTGKLFSEIIKTNEDNQISNKNETTFNIFDNVPQNNIQQIEKPLFNEKTKENNVFTSNNLFETEGKQSNLFGQFTNATPTNIITNTPIDSNTLFSTPKNQVSNDQIKELMKKADSSEGSLFKADNPFLSKNTKADIPIIFKSPQSSAHNKESNTINTLFSQNTAPLFSINNPTNSNLFAANAENKTSNPFSIFSK